MIGHCATCGIDLTAGTMGDEKDALGLIRRCHWCEDGEPDPAIIDCDWCETRPSVMATARGMHLCVECQHDILPCAGCGCDYHVRDLIQVESRLGLSGYCPGCYGDDGGPDRQEER